MYQALLCAALALMEIVVSVAGSVNEFGAEEWSSAATGRGLYASRQWHLFLEADLSYDAWYVAARRPHGALLGLLPVYLYAGGPQGGVDSYYDPHRLFGDRPSGSDGAS